MTYPLFISELIAEASLGDKIDVFGSEGVHAGTVKRIQLGENILLTDGRGVGAQAKVLNISKKGFTAQLTTTPIRKKTEGLEISVVQGLAKGVRIDLALQILTEVGVNEIIIWQSERSIAKWDDSKLAKRLNKAEEICRQAMKQSRRFTCPKIGFVKTRNLAEKLISPVIVLHEDARQNISELTLPDKGKLTVVVGPEGGISNQETQIFDSCGAKFVSISDGILRTSTAGAIAVSQIKLLTKLKADPNETV